jgi:hypothetical protein
MRLFHFSDNAAIHVFKPKPVAAPSKRPAGLEWLNGPLVWAIDEWHQPMYLFPRDCPRILIWPLAATSQDDRDRWFGQTNARMIAYIEQSWSERHASNRIHRYELPGEGFADLNNAGMWVSRAEVRPLAMTTIENLPAALAEQGVELRPIESLATLKPLWSTSLHVSGIRLRNAASWA